MHSSLTSYPQASRSLTSGLLEPVGEVANELGLMPLRRYTGLSTPGTKQDTTN